MDEIYKKHKYWIGLAYSFGITDFPEDAVQDAYIKIYGNENVNQSYFGFVLRSVCIDIIRKKKIDTIPFYDNLDTPILEDAEETDITDILFYLDSWTSYEKTIYRLWIEENISLRKFALKHKHLLKKENNTYYTYWWLHYKLKELRERLKQIKH